MGMQALEQRLERMVEGVFRRSRNTIRPIELGRRLLREMDDTATVDVRGERVATNDFVILLSPVDHAGFADIEDALRTELVEACREYAREEGYHFMGPVRVELRVDNALRPGRFGIVSQLRQGEAGLRPGVLVLPTGERKNLPDGATVIGRNNDCGIVVPDGNVSRRHAQIQRSGNAFVINDLGSTNGTYVNQHRLVTEHRLSDGDVITIGPVTFHFEAS